VKASVAMQLNEYTPDSKSNLDYEQTLIEQLKVEDSVAWESLYERYSPAICRWASCNGVTCPHEQENVVQDVFTKVLKNIGSFKRLKDRGSFSAWLYVITRNHIRSSRKGRLVAIGGATWQRSLDEIPFPRNLTSLQVDSAQEMRQKRLDQKSEFVSTIFAWIDNRYRPKSRNKAVLKDLLLDNKSATEVAQKHSVTTNVIYQIKSRMVAQIREEFDSSEGTKKARKTLG